VTVFIKHFNKITSVYIKLVLPRRNLQWRRDWTQVETAAPGTSNREQEADAFVAKKFKEIYDITSDIYFRHW